MTRKAIVYILDRQCDDNCNPDLRYFLRGVRGSKYFVPGTSEVQDHDLRSALQASITVPW